MDKTIFIDKLKDFLNRHSLLTEECEIIFVMVQMRKILDCGGTPYRTLRFYCNWVLHNELSRETTTKLLIDIFRSGIDSKKSGHDNARNLISNNYDFFTFKTLKNELKDFINEHTLPTNILNNRNWKNFRKLLLEIIKDCQVSFVPTEISSLKVTKRNDKLFAYTFTLINGRKPVIKLKI